MSAKKESKSVRYDVSLKKQYIGSQVQKAVEKAADVISETLSSNKRKLTSEHTLTADEALEAGENSLVTATKKLESQTVAFSEVLMGHGSLESIMVRLPAVTLPMYRTCIWKPSNRVQISQV